MKNKLVLQSLLMCLVFLFFSYTSKQLTDEKAKETVLRVMQHEPRASLKEWQGLIKNGDNEMKGRAIISCSGMGGPDQQPTVEFYFHRNADNNWVLDKMEGIDGVITQGVGDWTRQTVLEKVEK